MKIFGLTLQSPISIKKDASTQTALTQAPLRSDFVRTPSRDVVSFGKKMIPISIDSLDTNGIGLYMAKLKRLPNLVCAYCSEVMLSPKMHNKLANDLAQARGNKLANSIKANMNFFKGEMQEIAMDLAEFATTHPKFDAVSLMKAFSSEVQHRHVLKLLDGEGPYPDKFDFKELFVIKNAEIPPREFFGKMLRGAMATTEHIRPRERGGRSELSNMCVVCSHCNGMRGHKRLSDFADLRPELSANIKKQFEALSAVHGMEIPKYTGKIAKTFMYESNGKIDLSEFI